MSVSVYGYEHLKIGMSVSVTFKIRDDTDTDIFQKPNVRPSTDTRCDQSVIDALYHVMDLIQIPISPSLIPISPDLASMMWHFASMWHFLISHRFRAWHFRFLASVSTRFGISDFASRFGISQPIWLFHLVFRNDLVFASQ